MLAIRGAFAAHHRAAPLHARPVFAWQRDSIGDLSRVPQEGVDPSLAISKNLSVADRSSVLASLLNPVIFVVSASLSASVIRRHKLKISKRQVAGRSLARCIVSTR